MLWLRIVFEVLILEPVFAHRSKFTKVPDRSSHFSSRDVDVFWLFDLGEFEAASSVVPEALFAFVFVKRVLSGINCFLLEMSPLIMEIHSGFIPF